MIMRETTSGIVYVSDVNEIQELSAGEGDIDYEIPDIPEDRNLV